ncbi:MAG: NAD-dependent epimerase/dehydratase family protein [Candidatus Helarchaeota archaeon]|nr:NAD-dependent epimerase/dehydratase family protein [Candidatus Helarchaeota archaeon]
MEKVLITGCAGLVGSECCKLFAENGYKVIGVDNYMRGKIFGKEGNTRLTIQHLMKKFDIELHEIDIRDKKMVDLIKDSDSIIHTAAQPSHPKSIEIPMEDFEINVYGTIFLLETLRKENKEAPFVFCSTNKVYGEVPNFYAYEKIGKRFEPVEKILMDGFDETTQIDRCMHTPFGVSKTAADLYTQEYALLYGLKTGCFRMGCITGGAARAVEIHNWEPFFVKKALKEEVLTIFGYEGYQVRDVIHARDLALLFDEFIKNPKSGEVYNIGGGRKNSISMLESFDLIEKITGKKMIYEFGPQREADHIWWISNINKAKTHYPKWDIRINLEEIFTEIYEKLSEELKI